MKTFSHLAILSALFAITSAAVLDLTEVCINKRPGDVVAHPLDCQAYFICGPIPSVRYCQEGQHFDRSRNVCNTPENAKCDLQSLGNNETIDQLEESEQNSKPNVVTLRSQPIFIAIDVETGLAVDPLEKYDPKNIGCHHFGAYFMPHPFSCRRYFICAYGHLHKHKCGPGTAWNYKRQECELDADSDCYSRSLSGIDIDAGNTQILDESSEDLEALENLYDKSSTTTTTTMPSTVCFVIDTTIVTGTTGSTWNPTGTTWNPTGTTWNPTGTYHTATPTTAKPTTGRIDGLSADLQCPRNGEAYLPNIKDCSKYFICIAGRPVATSCPQGLYWDQNSEFCDLAKNVKCYQK